MIDGKNILQNTIDKEFICTPFWWHFSFPLEDVTGKSSERSHGQRWLTAKAFNITWRASNRGSPSESDIPGRLGFYATILWKSQYYNSCTRKKNFWCKTPLCEVRYCEGWSILYWSLSPIYHNLPLLMPKKSYCNKMNSDDQLQNNPYRSLTIIISIIRQ